MAVPVIEEYLADVETIADVTLVTGAGTQAGWWLLAVAGWDWDTPDEVPAPSGTYDDWELLGAAWSGVEDRPHLTAWARRVDTAGAKTIVFDVPADTFPDNHCRVYVISGGRPVIARRAYAVRGSGSGVAETAQAAAGPYSPDEEGLQIVVWCAGGDPTTATNYTMPGALTAQAEVDSASSTSRSGYRSLAAHGATGALTATAAVAHAWAALSIVVRPDSGEVTFPAPLGVRLEAAPGAEVLVDDPDDWPWQDITASWHASTDIEVEDGRSEGAVQAESSTFEYTLKNNDGQWTPDDARSSHWPDWAEGCPTRCWVNPGNGWDVLPGSSTFVGDLLPSWPGGSSKHAIVKVVGRGLLDFLGRGQDVARSAPYRTIAAGGPVAGWAMDDGRDADFGASIIEGGPSLRIGFEADPASVQMAPWLPPVVGPGATGQIQVEGDLTMPPGTTEWWVDFACMIGPATAARTRLFGDGPAADGAPRIDWEIDVNGVFSGGAIRLYRYTEEATSGSVLQVGEVLIPGIGDDALHHYRLRVSDVGADVTWAIDRDGVEVDSDTIAASALWQPGTKVRVTTFDSGLEAHGYGYLSVWAAQPPDISSAVHGYRYEPAAVRVRRTCDETGIRITIDGDPAASEPMGPQYPGQVLDTLRSCEAADRGVLGEDGFGLHYLPRAERYNRTAALVIDADERELHKDFAPRRDLQRVRNEWTVGRRDGSQATVRDAVHQSRRGKLADSSPDLDVASDLVLADHASWRVHEGTTPGMRHPELATNLHAAPELIDAWLGLRLGDWVAAINMMPQYPPGGLLQLVEGRKQTVRHRTWFAGLQVSPAAPWIVGIAEDEVLGRADTDGSELTADFDAGVDTSMSVAVTAGELWITTAAFAVQFPFDIQCAGVHLRVTGITGGSSPQTLTVDVDPLNTVVKTIPAGTPLSLLYPLRAAL